MECSAGEQDMHRTAIRASYLYVAIDPIPFAKKSPQRREI
ncbi:hypothetical protein BofuT4_uP154250.1 [Botrytis cinerea T4]|uniref:Uncharacterized protein n=1 Tax=Botryotinia fuckeliana (strain T4) TaxID=999810 RepID=G2YVG5_BOTF4|nr:hypothetical protein BofuT4_uP154250.1 [Botrytis cinerea T4]